MKFPKSHFEVIPYHSNPQNTDNANIFAKLPSLLEEYSEESLVLKTLLKSRPHLRKYIHTGKDILKLFL